MSFCTTFQKYTFLNILKSYDSFEWWIDQDLSHFGVWQSLSCFPFHYNEIVDQDILQKFSFALHEGKEVKSLEHHFWGTTTIIFTIKIFGKYVYTDTFQDWHSALVISCEKRDHVWLRQCARVSMCTSSKRRLCSFCSSIRFCRSCSSWRLCSSGSLRWAASCACCLFKASERSLFSCCSRRKSLRNVDSPGTFKIELQTDINRNREELAVINIV